MNRPPACRVFLHRLARGLPISLRPGFIGSLLVAIQAHLHVAGHAIGPRKVLEQRLHHQRHGVVQGAILGIRHDRAFIEARRPSRQRLRARQRQLDLLAVDGALVGRIAHQIIAIHRHRLPVGDDLAVGVGPLMRHLAIALEDIGIVGLAVVDRPAAVHRIVQRHVHVRTAAAGFLQAMRQQLFAYQPGIGLVFETVGLVRVGLEAEAQPLQGRFLLVVGRDLGAEIGGAPAQQQRAGHRGCQPQPAPGARPCHRNMLHRLSLHGSSLCTIITGLRPDGGG